jgi:hypothetical protein
MAQPRVIFARTRHEYDSYKDLWYLVEVSGFRLIYVDEIDLHKNAIFVTTPWNGDTAPALAAARERSDSRGWTRAKMVWWNLEQWDEAPLGPRIDTAMSLCDAVWASDTAFAALDPRMSYVAFGSHPDLGCPLAERPLFDVAHLSYLWGRRANVVGALAAKGLRIAPAAWTRQDKHNTLAASRLMLSLHQYDRRPRVIAPLRCAMAAAYRLPFLTETIDSPPTTLTPDDYAVVSTENAVEVIAELLRDHDRLNDLSWRIFRQLCIEHRFDECIARAAKELYR